MDRIKTFLTFSLPEPVDSTLDAERERQVTDASERVERVVHMEMIRQRILEAKSRTEQRRHT